MTYCPEAPRDHEPYRLNEGWFIVVAGRVHGPWATKEYAQAGYEVELRRAKKRKRGTEDTHAESEAKTQS